MTVDVGAASATNAGGATAWHLAGEWAFKQRSWLPVPLAVIVLLTRVGEWPGDIPVRLGIGCVLLGEALRFWTVRQIGVISRTRADRRGPLIASGPYRLVRNPIYIGNWFIWTGFVLASGIVWMLVPTWVLFALQYSAIVRWEERGLLAHHGAPYAEYMRRVSRWMPGVPLPNTGAGSLHPWPDVVFSERGTLGAIAAMALLIALKRLVF